MLQLNKETYQVPALLRCSLGTNEHKGDFPAAAEAVYMPSQPRLVTRQRGGENMHHDNAAQQQFESISSLIVTLRGI